MTFGLEPVEPEKILGSNWTFVLESVVNLEFCWWLKRTFGLEPFKHMQFIGLRCYRMDVGEVPVMSLRRNSDSVQGGVDEH